MIRRYRLMVPSPRFRFILPVAAMWMSLSQGVGAEPPAQRMRVYVSIPPQKHFVEQVGGEKVDVTALLAPGQSPATYEITPKQMVELGKARVYFRIGVPFEKSVVAKIGGTLEGLHIVDTREGIELRGLTAGERHEHGSGSAHGHADCAEDHGEQGDLDPHTWMNPRLVKIQARTICDELGRLDPVHRKDYERRLGTFMAELDSVDSAIAAKLGPFRGREFFVFHPAYGYFADAYGLRQTAVQSGGKAPTAKRLSGLIKRARDAGVRLIFVQPQFDRNSAETIAEAIGGAVVPIDPLAEDYLDNLLEMADRIEEALKGDARRRE